MLWKGTFPALVSGLGHGIILSSNEHKVQGLLCYSILTSIQYYCSHNQEMEKNSKKLMFSHLFLLLFCCVHCIYPLSLSFFFFHFRTWESISTTLHFFLFSISCCLQTHWLLYSEFLSSHLPLHYSCVDGIVMSLWKNILSLFSTF